MTELQKVSSIKRINERLREIERKLGADSSEADRYRNAISVASKGNLTSSGLLSHGKKAVEEISDEALTALEERETAGQIRAAQKRVAEAEGISEEEARDLWNTIEDLKHEDDAMYLSDAFTSYGFYDNHQGSRPSYEDIKKVLTSYAKVPQEEKDKIRKAAEKRHFKEKEAKASDRVQKSSGRASGSTLKVEEANPFKTGSVEDSMQ